MRKIDELKLKLKGMAKDIKDTRIQLREAQKNNGASSSIMFALYLKRCTYRNYHIAYCELRGRSRDQIEKPREHNNANEYEIEKIKKAFAWEVAEQVA